MVTTEGSGGLIAGALRKEAVESGNVGGNDTLNSQVFTGGVGERIGMGWDEVGWGVLCMTVSIRKKK